MKAIVHTLTLTLLLFFSGCLESVTPERITLLASQTEQLSVRVDEYQSATAGAIDDLKTAGLVSDTTAEKVGEVSEKIDDVQAKVVEVAEAVRQADYSGGDSVTTALEAARAGNVATGAWNPYAPLIEIALGSAAALAAYFARRKSLEAAASTAKYQAHKQGVEKTMKEVSASDSADVKNVEARLYANIGQARAAIGVK